MDDLWVFNFQTLRWTEVKFEKDAVKPCARRFHSSCMIGNELFVIAGCYGKYRCLKDVYSMDLSSLIQTHKTEGLSWVERNISNSSMLTRWGHSSVVYN
jgi:Kelch motif